MGANQDRGGAACSKSDFLWDGPAGARRVLLLAPGAGADRSSPFMATVAGELGARGIRVGRFDFRYMMRRREDGKRRPPDREPVLRAAWEAAIRDAREAEAGAAGGGLFIGGKSMGGRIASLVAGGAGVAGLVCLGYPFHPVGKPDRLRVAQLRDLTLPALIVQGERDTFGRREEVAGYGLPAGIALRWLADGDHSFKPRKASGRTVEQNIAAAVDAVATFVLGR